MVEVKGSDRVSEKGWVRISISKKTLRKLEKEREKIKAELGVENLHLSYNKTLEIILERYKKLKEKEQS